MSGNSSGVRKDTREKLGQLRKDLGLFSFHEEFVTSGFSVKNRVSPELGVRPGGIVEWLVAKPGAGAVTSALQIASASDCGRGVLAIVDPARECYVPALLGWGIDSCKTLLIRPGSLGDACWAIEQCLRCPGVSATWAWVKERISERVRRRWQLAAEVGGGVGLVFRPIEAKREPVWADLRLLIAPLAGGQEETRLVRIEVLYRRGGTGGGATVWEIDHAAGTVRLVPKVANPTAAERAARA
jgi:protein ImuA